MQPSTANSSRFKPIIRSYAASASVCSCCVSPLAAHAWMRRRIVRSEHPGLAMRSYPELCASACSIQVFSDDDYFDLLGERYSHLRQFAPALLDALSLRGSAPDDDLLDAIDLLRRLNQTGRRRVADSAPTNFVPARWQSYVIDADGRIDRRYYELCALWELRAALRAGDVWVDGSRRYANPETYLIPREQWRARRAEACRLTGTPENGVQRLRQRQADLEAILVRLDGGFPQ